MIRTISRLTEDVGGLPTDALVMTSRSTVFVFAALGLAGCIDDVVDDGHDHGPFAELVSGANTQEQALAEAGRWQPSAPLTAASDIHDVDYDSAPPWDGGVNCSGGPTAGARAVRDVVIANFPQVATVGIYNCRVIAGTNSMSLHSVGRALDIMIPTTGGDADNGSGDPIAAWLLENAGAIGVQSVIWDRTIWSVSRSPRARAYTGSSPHIDHLHVELNEAGAFENLPWYAAPIGPVVEPCPVLGVDGGILDDGPCKQLFGNPAYWRQEVGGHDGSLQWTNAFVSPAPGNHARFTVNLPAPDRYRVEVWLDPVYAKFSSTRYRVGDSVVVVDQGARAPAGGGFVALGDFDLDVTTAVAVEDNVVAIDENEARAIMVDAIRVTRIELASEEPVEPEEPINPVEPEEPLVPIEPGDDDKVPDGPVLDDDDPGAAGEPLFINVSKGGCRSGGDASVVGLVGGLLVLGRRRRR